MARSPFAEHGDGRGLWVSVRVCGDDLHRAVDAGAAAEEQPVVAMKVRVANQEVAHDDRGLPQVSTSPRTACDPKRSGTTH
jgi:hypothetical protein